MNYQIPLLALPEEVELSTKILPEEVERVTMKTIQVKAPKREDAGAAFHEKQIEWEKFQQRAEEIIAETDEEIEI